MNTCDEFWLKFSLKPADTLNFVAWSQRKNFFYTNFNWDPLKLFMNFNDYTVKSELKFDILLYEF